MKNMWQKIKFAFARFMQGRHGGDQLSTAMLFTGLFLCLLGNAVPLLELLGIALYALCLFRLFSRDNEKRTAENQKYLQLTEKLKTQVRQYKLRFDRRKEFKYFHCPQCKQLLRAKRGQGTKKITCPRCKHEFDVKT